MSYDRIVISSGHGLKVRGAAGSPIPPMLDEVDTVRELVEAVASELRDRGVWVKTYHDDVSTSQSENLTRIVDFHNSQTRALDISCHMNAFDGNAHGTEVLYVTQEALATELSDAIAGAGGFTNRGGKYRGDLKFLNSTEMPAVLLETAFCDNESDCRKYRDNFGAIVEAICDELGGEATDVDLPELPPEQSMQFHAKGRCSHFGGPSDGGVSPEEGLAFISDFMQQPELFLPYQPTGTSGLARRLNPQVHYVACRWDYSRTSKQALLEDVALVRAIRTGIALTAFPADWGPHEDTDRVADLSPNLMRDLGIETDDEVEVLWPYREDVA